MFEEGAGFADRGSPRVGRGRIGAPDGRVAGIGAGMRVVVRCEPVFRAGEADAPRHRPQKYVCMVTTNSNFSLRPGRTTKYVRRICATGRLRYAFSAVASSVSVGRG